MCCFIKYHPNCGPAKVAFLIGLSEQAGWNRWQKVGADGFLTKPFTVNYIRDYVNDILGLATEAAA